MLVYRYLIWRWRSCRNVLSRSIEFSEAVMKPLETFSIAIVICVSLCTTSCYCTHVGRAPGNEQYFCDGDCEVERTRCSCFSTCKSNRTCCTDYVESCEGGMSWAETECTKAEDMLCPEGYHNPAPVILLSIDGFRDIYLHRDLTPTISKLASCGVSAPYMIPVYPTKTFPNHYSIVTGLYPESHGIIANRIYDHDHEEEFRLGRDTAFHPHWWHGEPIWVSASNQGLKSATYFWPGSDVNITRYPDYYFRYDESVSNEEKVYQVMDWLDLPADERPSLIVLYTHIVDSAGHTGGPHGVLVDQSLKDVDKMIEMIMNGLRDRGLDTCVNFMITSDHGMASVDCLSKVKYLEDFGVDMNEVYFDGGPYGRIGKSMNKSLWDKFDAKEMKKKLECRRSETHWETFLKSEYLPKRYHYAIDPWIEDLHLVMDDEWWVDGESADGPGCSPGGHGYDNTYPDMRAFFTGHGRSLKRNYARSSPFENIELYNLFAELLGILPVENNGTRGSLFDMMATNPTITKEDDGADARACPYSGDVSNDDLGCQMCEGISESEANEMLNLDAGQVNQYNSQHMLYGRPRMFDQDVDFCVLTQRNYVTAYDNKLKLPRLSSFVLHAGNNWEPLSFRCARRDVRTDVVAVTPCWQYSGQAENNRLTWIFLYSPGLSDDDKKSDATITSNMVPSYEPFLEIWEFMSRTFNNWANLYNGISVDVGPIFDYDFNGHADPGDVRAGNGSFTLDGDETSTSIPTHFFIVVTRCKTYSSSRPITECSEKVEDVDVLSFIIPNYKEPQCHEEGESQEEWIPKLLLRHVSRIKDVELLTKISFFSDWVSGATASQESHLGAMRTKLDLPQPSDDWLQDFILSVTPSPQPQESTTSGAPHSMSSFVVLILCTILILAKNSLSFKY